MTELLTDDQVTNRLHGLSGWERVEDGGPAITATYKRADFAGALAFVNALGAEAEAMDHHPDIDIRWNTVTLVLSTHSALHAFGGSPIGNSRVKLTNAADLVKRGLVAEGVDPLQAAADRLTGDGVDVLHTICGDDTNTTPADLAAFLAEHGHGLTVVGLPHRRGGAGELR